MEHEYNPPKKPAGPDAPESLATPEKTGFFSGNILRVIKGEQPTEPHHVSERAPRPAEPEDIPRVEDQPEYERAGRVRRFARTVLRAVMAEAAAEPMRSKPLGTEHLTEAAEDLRGATAELGETMQHVREKPRDPGGFEFAPDEAPRRIFEDVVAERIAERMRRLEAEAEKTRAVSVLAAGLGIVAVLVAGHQYLARRRVEVSHRALNGDLANQRVNAARQGDMLASQRAEFNQLRTQRVADMARNQRRDYYEKLSGFTHNQADVTRETARELQEAADRPRRTWMRESRTNAETMMPEQKQTPLVRVEAADTIERLQTQATATPGGGAHGNLHVTHQAGDEPVTDTKPPLNPAAMRQDVARKARAAQLASTVWLYGVVLGAILIAGAVFFILLG